MRNFFVALNFRGPGRPRNFLTGDLRVRGYHVYQDVLSAAVGEVLSCEREPTNSRDRYAVVVKEGEVAVGHLSLESCI